MKKNLLVMVLLITMVLSSCSPENNMINQHIQPSNSRSVGAAAQEINMILESQKTPKVDVVKVVDIPKKNPRTTNKNQLAFKDLNIGALGISSVVLTPGQDPMKIIHVTFSSEGSLEDIHLILLDEFGYYLKHYQPVQEQLLLPEFGSESVYKTTIDGLNPNTRYRYFLLSGRDISTIGTFKTLSSTHSTLAFFGDIQGYKQSQYNDFKAQYDLVHEVVDSIDIHLLAGDLVDTGNSVEQWGYLKNVLGKPLSSELWMTTIGNHDNTPSDVIYKSTFNYPKNGVLDLEERSYFIDLPFARIAVWDTESIGTYDLQSQWLEEIMTERQNVFKILLMHRSVYPMAYDEGYIRKFSELFDTVGLDLVLSGHDHIYSRTTMTSDQQVSVGEGVTYLVGGSGSGSKYYEEINRTNRYWKNIVYDKNNPVFSILQMDGNQMNVEIYATEEGSLILIDHFNITKKE